MELLMQNLLSHYVKIDFTLGENWLYIPSILFRI